MSNYSLRFAYLSLTLIALFFVYVNFAWALPGNLRVSFLDIGQGDSILIRTPMGRNVLIDGGPGVTLLERLGEETSYWLKRIDLLILTHPDLDHLEGLVEAIRRYEVDRVMITGVFHSSNLYRAFLEELQARAIEVVIADPEQDWQLEVDVYLDIIGPQGSYLMAEVYNQNDVSIMAKLIYKDTQMLLPGDAELHEEHDVLLTDFDLRARVLKVGHHGSRTSSSLPFLRAVNPQEAVIISGRENPFDHPHLDTLLKYDQMEIDWINTKDVGTITLESDGKEWFKP